MRSGFSTRGRWSVVAGAAVLLAVPGMRGFAAESGDAAAVRKTVSDFLTAVRAGDDGAARALVATSGEESGAVTTYLELMTATARLQKAAVVKFGVTAESTFGASTEAVEARLKAIREAPIKMAGTSAILTIPEDAAAKQKAWTLILTKGGGGWKIEGTSLFNLAPENKVETQRRVALSAKLIGITNEMVKEINAGKYAAAVDAYQEFWTRTVAAAKELRGAAGTQPQ